MNYLYISTHRPLAWSETYEDPFSHFFADENAMRNYIPKILQNMNVCKVCGEECGCGKDSKVLPMVSVTENVVQMSRVTKKNLFDRAAQPQKTARGLKVRIWKEAELFYL